jgi:hypothetical protein
MWQLCRWGRLDICMTFHLIFFYTGVSAKTFEPNYLGYLPTDFYEILNADILDREGSVSNNKITSC